jgi:hypothetical protein
VAATLQTGPGAVLGTDIAVPAYAELPLQWMPRIQVEDVEMQDAEGA